MTKQVEAVYENGLLRPLEPLALKEHQRVTVAIMEPPAPLAAYLDHEYMEAINKEVEAMENVPSREEILKITMRDQASWAETIIAEREGRF
jgi:predicted DNA-binding antitoxin AbrB/MazE fold protein